MSLILHVSTIECMNDGNFILGKNSNVFVCNAIEKLLAFSNRIRPCNSCQCTALTASLNRRRCLTLLPLCRRAALVTWWVPFYCGHNLKVISKSAAAQINVFLEAINKEEMRIVQSINAQLDMSRNTNIHVLNIA